MLDLFKRWLRRGQAGGISSLRLDATGPPLSGFTPASETGPPWPERLAEIDWHAFDAARVQQRIEEARAWFGRSSQDQSTPNVWSDELRPNGLAGHTDEGWHDN